MRSLSILFIFLISVSFAGAHEIHTAVQEGNLQAVRQILTEHADALNVTEEPDETTPLHVAVYNGHLEIATYLIDAGAHLDASKANGSRPLHGAAFYGHPDCVRLLIESGAEVDIVNEGGFTPLLSGAAGLQWDCVALLREAGADPFVENRWGMGLLHYAAGGNQLDMIQELVQAGIPVDNITENGETPLMWAASSEHQEAVNLLVELGADVNHVSEHNWTPLMCAIEDGNAEMYQLLLSLGATIEPASPDSPQLLPFAMHQRNEEIVQDLFNRGISPSSIDDNGVPLLVRALRRGYDDMVALFLENGADVNAATRYEQQTPLHFAAKIGCQRVAELLVDHGAELNPRDKDQRTPLDLALYYNNPQLASWLRQHGGERNGCSPAGENLLQQPLDNGEAHLWYLGHCGWGVQTQNHFMIFDYWPIGAEPDEPCLCNGHILPEQLADYKVTVFVTHEHGDHFDQAIYPWAEQHDDITYVYGFQPEETQPYDGPEYVYTAPRQRTTVNGINLVTIRSNDSGVGFALQVDGFTFYHAGDHAGWVEGEEAEFTDEIDFVESHFNRVDFALVNVTGCRLHDCQTLDASILYTIEHLNPNYVIPTHGIFREFDYQSFAERMRAQGVETEIIVPEFRGDRYTYRNEEVI